jgi:hypothetical protein
MNLRIPLLVGALALLGGCRIIDLKQLTAFGCNERQG